MSALDFENEEKMLSDGSNRINKPCKVLGSANQAYIHVGELKEGNSDVSYNLFLDFAFENGKTDGRYLCYKNPNPDSNGSRENQSNIRLIAQYKYLLGVQSPEEVAAVVERKDAKTGAMVKKKVKSFPGLAHKRIGVLYDYKQQKQRGKLVFMDNGRPAMQAELKAFFDAETGQTAAEKKEGKPAMIIDAMLDEILNDANIAKQAVNQPQAPLPDPIGGASGEFMDDIDDSDVPF